MTPDCDAEERKKMDGPGITSTNKVWINRSFSNEVTVAILVFQVSETAAMLVNRRALDMKP